MSGSVTYCRECGACNWAYAERCAVCGGELEPTLREVLAYLYSDRKELKEVIDESH